MVRGAFYKRTVDNIYLMESLDNEELNTLSKEESTYYNNFVNKPKFAKEVNEDGTISLVALHDENSNLKKYFLFCLYHNTHAAFNDSPQSMYCNIMSIYGLK